MGLDIENRLVYGFKIPYEFKSVQKFVTKYNRETGEPEQESEDIEEFTSSFKIDNLPPATNYWDLGKIASQATYQGLEIFTDTHILICGVEIPSIGESWGRRIVIATQFEKPNYGSLRHKLRHITEPLGLWYVPYISS